MTVTNKGGDLVLRTDSIERKCPKCKAGRGEPCIKLDGGRARTVHPQRAQVVRRSRR